MQQQVLSEEGHPQIGGEGQHVQLQARELLAEACAFCGKGEPGTTACMVVRQQQQLDMLPLIMLHLKLTGLVGKCSWQPQSCS